MTLRLFSPWSPSVMRSLPWAVRAAGGGPGDAAGHNPLNPDDAEFYRDGEFLQDGGVAGTLIRGGTHDPAAREIVSNSPHYQIFGERGRTDLAAMAGDGRGNGGKVTVIRIHQYEAQTDIVSGTAGAQPILGGVLGNFAAGDPLLIGNVWTAVGGACMRGFIDPTGVELAALVGGETPVARVVSVNANTGFVRFLIR
jgi:hypothetical protein